MWDEGHPERASMEKADSMTDPSPEPPPANARAADEREDILDVAVIGSGFGGIAMGRALKRMGRRFVILEAADAPGGTWRDNCYPGAACDVPSHLYCFSFLANPDWGRKYSPQVEIQRYLVDSVARLGLDSHLRLGARVTRASFDEGGTFWSLDIAGGRRLRARHVVAACGQLRNPKLPEIEGRDSFAGQAFHSSRWPKDLSLDGRRVGVIGSGATAIQIVPAIAGRAAHITMFQRTPNWIIARKDRAYSSLERWAFTYLPGWQKLYRAWIYWNFEMRWPAFSKNSRLRPFLERRARRYMREQLAARPDLWEKLTPDYPMGCKRILISDDFYPALTRSDVTLETRRIARIEPQGVRLADDALVPLDVLVFATGFRADDFVAPMEVRGRDGRSLAQVWEQGPFAYNGIAVPGFPNFFLLYGPNTNLGHNSIVFMLEQQIAHITRLLRTAERRGVTRIEAHEDAAEAFRAEMRRALRDSVWLAGCGSWYLSADGSSPTNWPHSTLSFAWRMRHLRQNDYALI